MYDSEVSSARTSRSNSPCSHDTLTPASTRPSTSNQEPKRRNSVRLPRGRQGSITSTRSSVTTRSQLRTYPSRHGIPLRRSSSSSFAMTSENPFLQQDRQPKPFQSLGTILHPQGPASPSSAPLLMNSPPVSPSSNSPAQHQHTPTFCWLFPSTRMKRYEKLEDSTTIKKIWRRIAPSTRVPKVTMVEKCVCKDTDSVRRYTGRHTKSVDGPSKYCGWKLFGMRKEPSERRRALD